MKQNANSKPVPVILALVLATAVAGCTVPEARPGIALRDRNRHAINEVVPGALYRTGQPTAQGLTNAASQYGIRTVINLRGGEPNPDVGGGGHEKQFCERHGMRYIHLPVDPYQPDLFPSTKHPERSNPAYIDRFLAIMRDRNRLPVLIHCAGGRHRTGLLAAVYRIDQQGWSVADATAEMIEYGFQPEDFGNHRHILEYLQYLASKR